MASFCSFYMRDAVSNKHSKLLQSNWVAERIQLQLQFVVDNIEDEVVLNLLFRVMNEQM